MILFVVNDILSHILNKGKSELEQNHFYDHQEDRNGKLSKNEI